MVEIALNIMPSPNPALSARPTPSSTRPSSPTPQKSYAAVVAGSSSSERSNGDDSEAPEDLVTQVKIWKRGESKKAWVRAISKIVMVMAIVVISS